MSRRSRRKNRTPWWRARKRCSSQSEPWMMRFGTARARFRFVCLSGGFGIEERDSDGAILIAGIVVCGRGECRGAGDDDSLHGVVFERPLQLARWARDDE